MNANLDNFNVTLRKGELKALLACATKDPRRDNIRTVQFFVGAAAATDGHVAIAYASKGFCWNSPDTSPHIVARKCIPYKREALDVALKACQKNSIVMIDTKTDTAKVVHVDRYDQETLAAEIDLERYQYVVPPIDKVIPKRNNGDEPSTAVIGWFAARLVTVVKALADASDTKLAALRFSFPAGELDVTRVDHLDPTTDRTWTAVFMPARI